jgi:hypothetical protein
LSNLPGEVTLINIVPAIILIIVAAIAGYGLGILDSRLTGALKQKIDDSAEEKKEKKEETVNPDEHTVLKVTVNLALKWHVELDGVRVEPENLTAEQRTRLVNTVVQIRPWIDAKPAPSPAPQPPAPRLAPVSMASANAPTIPPPRVDIARGVRTLIQNEVKKPEAPPMSIVAMIDDVLQKQLAGTPLEEKGIHLEEGAVGEVIVLVGKEYYPGIDAVPDPEIRGVIRTAIATWEKK